MQVLGILGGVASGKSLAADFLRQLGAAVIDGDAAGHEVLRDAEVIHHARTRWGDAILEEDGQIRRSALAERVFAEGASEELRFLENLTHGRIRAVLQQQIDALRRDGRTPVAVLDAALLLKSGWDDLCDFLLFIDAPRPLRLQRATARGWDPAELDRREAAQGSLAAKRARADLVLQNTGTAEELRAQIVRFWDSHLAANMRH